jgi:AraC-like DNA-binding protein
MEFLYFIRGSAIIYINSSPIQAREGDLIIVNSNELHAGENTSGELDYICVIVGVSHLHGAIVDPVETKYITPIERNLILFDNKISGVQNIAACIENIAEEYKAKRLGYELEVKSNIYHLLAILMRNHVNKILTKGEYRTRVKNLERFKDIFRYMDENYTEEITIEKLSKMVNLSGFHFCRIFKELTGKTLSEYVNGLRISKAEKLLLDPDLSVSEIAAQSGYNDINYFSRMFKKHRKMSPTRFRAVSNCQLSI